MARRSSGGRPAPRPAPRPSQPRMRNPPAPAKPAPPPAPAANRGGSIFRSIGGSIADGFGWGVGTSIGHRAVEAVMGPRVIQHAHVSSAPAAPASAQDNAPENPNACNVHSKAFSDCINANGSDISKCQYYLDMLNECRRSSPDMLLA
ncbi:hypothetical protein LUZ62_070897 [Rhynchospora pubera]|uniref:CHCH domain-containing protein n=1 Tax=Rhynchospora pubera TaxID=906938 RepID=A0AAV8CXG8_9POAL|nr:hypothetical protein LUZ62_070897 [Rhynchospora pubera]